MKLWSAIREFFSGHSQGGLVPTMAVFPPPEDAWCEVTTLDSPKRIFYNPARNEYRSEAFDPVIDPSLIPLKEDRP